jgi:hypothetical protein
MISKRSPFENPGMLLRGRESKRHSREVCRGWWLAFQLRQREQPSADVKAFRKCR